ncbi:hypothetical protein N7465_007067 [Penicillium sp. CMV-2018d]|nr:hypothetical protein N7465_007067 [Penicillium sp. CMV-2018d]
MRRPPLAKGHMRSASCPPTISKERSHASQMDVQPTTLTPRDPDCTIGTTSGSATSPQTPASDTKELVSNESEATPGLTEDAGGLSQSPTGLPEPTSSPRESVTSLSNSKAALEELATSLPDPGSNPRESATALKELPEGER